MSERQSPPAVGAHDVPRGAMGNDITGPAEIAAWADDGGDDAGMGDATGAAATVTFTGRSDHWLDPGTPLQHHDDGVPVLPEASFRDLRRFNTLPPLEALRAYVGRARQLADRARWESGVVARNVQAGQLDFAREVAEQARGNERAARFFAALGRTALETWAADREGRSASIGGEQLLARMDREVADAGAALQRALGFLGETPSPDA